MCVLHASVIAVLALLSAGPASTNGDESALVLTHYYPLIQDDNFSYVQLTCSGFTGAVATGPCGNISFELNGTDIGQRLSVSECPNGSVRFVLSQRYEGEFTCTRDGSMSNTITLAAQPDYEPSGERIQWVELEPFNSKVTTTHLVCAIKPGVLRERYTVKWSQYVPATNHLQDITPDSSTFDLLLDVTTELNGSQYQCVVTINHNGSLEQTYTSDKIILYVGMNNSLGTSPLSQAGVVAISFFGPALLTAVIVTLLVFVIYLCYRYKCLKCESFVTSKATLTMYYNHSTVENPSTNDSITSPSHSSQSPMHLMSSVKVVDSQNVDLDSEQLLLSTVIVNDSHNDLPDTANTYDVCTPQLSSRQTEFQEFHHDGVGTRLPHAIPEEEEEGEGEGDGDSHLLIPDRRFHSVTPENGEEQQKFYNSRILTSEEGLVPQVIPEEERDCDTRISISEGEEANYAPKPPSQIPARKNQWTFTDIESPMTDPLSSDDWAVTDLGMSFQGSNDYNDTRFAYYGCLPDQRFAHSASQISTAGCHSQLGLNEDYSVDASQRSQYKHPKHKKGMKKENRHLATDTKTGDSGVGQSLSPEKSLSPRRVWLTQGTPEECSVSDMNLSLGHEHNVDNVSRNIRRHWSVSDPRTLNQRRTYIKRRSAAHSTGKGSLAAETKQELVRKDFSGDMTVPSHTRPSNMDLPTREHHHHHHHAKSHRGSSSRHVTEGSHTVPRKEKRNAACTGTLTTEQQYCSQQDAQISNSRLCATESSHTLPRRPKPKVDTLSRQKHQQTEPQRSSSDHSNTLPRKEKIKVDCKNTLSQQSQQYHHRSLSQAGTCETSTKHAHTLPRGAKGKAAHTTRENTQTVKQQEFQPKSPVGSSPQCKQTFSVPKCIRPTATLQDCTSDGVVFEDESNGFTLTIGKGAIAEGDRLTIDIGVALHGPFSYPEGTRPVSPVFWMCVREDEFYKFKKPVDITIQHFLSISTEEERERMGISFVKASHTLNHNGKYSFEKITESQLFKPNTQNGMVITNHFCYQCIVSNISEQTLHNSNFCLFGTLPNTFVYDRPMYVFFYVTFFLNACLETVRRQIAKSQELSHCKYSEVKTEFQFAKDVSPPSIAIQCPQSLPGGWQMGIEFKKKITLRDIDFMARDRDDLQFKEDEGIYPPHFRVVIDGTCTIEKATAHLKFSGTANDLVFDMHLVPPTLTKGPQSLSQASMYPPPAPTQLPPLKLKQLMNLVVSKIPCQWKWFGIELEVPESERNFDTYPVDDAKECFIRVIMSWRKCGQPEFKWETVLEVLESENLSEKRLAMDVRSELTSRHTLSPYYQQEPALSCPDETFRP